MVKVRTSASIVAISGTIIAILFVAAGASVLWSPQANQSPITGPASMQTDYSITPEVFDVRPSDNVLRPDEISIDSTYNEVTPAISYLTNPSASADFVIPLIQEAFALDPEVNSATFTEWTVPTANAGVRSPKYDPATNSIWFSEANVNRIAKLDLNTNPPTLTEWTLPTANAVPVGLVMDSSTGRIYFIENAVSKLARLDPVTNGITEWSLPLNMPGFAAQPVSYLWLTMSSTGNLYTHSRCQVNCQFGHQWVLELNPTTNFARAWNIAGGSANLEGITVDNTSGQTVVWVTEKVQNTVDRLIITGPSANQLTKWAIPQPSSAPWWISVDPNGVVYFSQQNGNRMARLVPSTNEITQWIVPTAASNPAYMTTDPAGIVYFGEYNTNKIGRLVPSTNIFTEWTVPSSTSRPAWTHTDSSGNLYFAEEGNNIKIGRMG